jgi:hypothetical protein
MDSIKSIAIPSKRRRGGEKPQAVVGAGHSDIRAKGVAQQAARTAAQTVQQPRHLYRVGQRVRMLGGGNRWARVESLCRIVVLMPHESGPPMYRVRSEAESYERVVAEIDLQPIA